MTARIYCGPCGGYRLHAFLDLGKTPLANKFPATSTEEEEWYSLGLCRCDGCGLVQGTELVPDHLVFGDDYGFYTGASSAQRADQQTNAELLLHRHGVNARKLTVEIGCNDGTLLKHFADADCRALGVDPSRPAQLAIGAGLNVKKEPFTSELARSIRHEYGPAGLVIAYNCLAHVNDLADVLTGIWELLSWGGVAVVELQYLPDLLTGNLIGQIYHEHRYY